MCVYKNTYYYYGKRRQNNRVSNQNIQIESCKEIIIFFALFLNVHIQINQHVWYHYLDYNIYFNISSMVHIFM